MYAFFAVFMSADDCVRATLVGVPNGFKITVWIAAASPHQPQGLARWVALATVPGSGAGFLGVGVVPCDAP